MTKTKNILQFICYNPRIYSGFDNFQVKLTKKLNDHSFQNVLVYSDTLNLQKLKKDILDNHGIIETISTGTVWQIIRDLIRIFKKYKPSVVHSHFDNRIHFLVALFALFSRTTFYFSFWSELTPLKRHEYIKTKGIIKYILIRSYYAFLVLVSRNGLMGSNALRSQFKELHPEHNSKILTFYLGTEIFSNRKSVDSLREDFRIPEGFTVISNISAIEPIKGIHILIDALILLKVKYHYQHFICFHIGKVRGGTIDQINYSNSLTEKVRSSGLDENFIWLDYLEDVTDILKMSDIYVHPSIQEGLGSANLEAATQSLPIIGMDTGGMSEIVHDGINGFLLQDFSAESLCDCINILLNDKQLRLKMGAESYHLVTKTFNVENQVEMLVKIYFTLLQK